MAAINNHYALCKYLIEQGIDVNAKGGPLAAPAIIWAAHKCNYYIVNLLLQSGADPFATDTQGNSLLHLATFDGNVFQLVLVLHQNVPIDAVDLEGRTCLMWAAFLGYPACVDLLLSWGANVRAMDENGFTALHKAVAKGSQACIQQLLEYGADRFAQAPEGKTPATIASEWRTTGVWHRALTECGYDDEGHSKILFATYGSFLKQRTFLNKFLFFEPFLVLFTVIYISSHMVVFAAIPLSLFCVYGFQWVAQSVLVWAPSDMRHIHRTVSLCIPGNIKRLADLLSAISDRHFLGYGVLARHSMAV